jgi:hypothetical protein
LTDFYQYEPHTGGAKLLTFDIEAPFVSLEHAHAGVARVYAELNLNLAFEVAKQAR